MDVSVVWSRVFCTFGLLVSAGGIGGRAFAGAAGPQAQDQPIVYGRPAAPLPGNPERYYERRVVRRTVVADPGRVASHWSPVVLPTAGAVHPALWMQWDDQSIAFGVEVGRNEPLVVDIDMDGDDFDKGMANLRVAVEGGQETAVLHRWERKPGPEPGLWKEVPKVDGAITVARSESLCIVVLRKSSAWELPLRAGAPIGVRIHPAQARPALVPPDPQPSLRLELADEIPAAAAGITVRVSPRRREIVPGAKARVSVEVANVSEGRVSLRQVQIGGGEGDSGPVSGSTIPGVELAPGERLRRDVELQVSDSVGIASFLIETAATLADGRVVVAKTSLDRIEPFAVEMQMPAGNVAAGADERNRTRLAMVVLRGKSDINAEGAVELTVPPGWIVDGPTKRAVQMSYATEVKGAPFKIRVPLGAPSGVYPVSAVVTIAGRTYEVRSQVTVSGGG